MTESTFSLFVGPAGEAFVEYDLLRRGVWVHRSASGSGYDLIAEHAGKLRRIEVKTTAASVEKRKGRGQTQIVYRFPFADGASEKYRDVEVFAFVALDHPAVLYVPWFDVGARTHHKDFSLSKISEAGRSFDYCFGETGEPVAPEQDAGGNLVAMDVVTGETKAFGSVAEAVGVGFSASGISNCLRGRLRTHRGHSFRRVCG